jgi:hypothetical protein
MITGTAARYFSNRRVRAVFFPAFFSRSTL